MQLPFQRAISLEPVEMDRLSDYALRAFDGNSPPARLHHVGERVAGLGKFGAFLVQKVEAGHSQSMGARPRLGQPAEAENMRSVRVCLPWAGLD